MAHERCINRALAGQVAVVTGAGRGIGPRFATTSESGRPCGPLRTDSRGTGSDFVRMISRREKQHDRCDVADLASVSQRRKQVNRSLQTDF